MNKIIMPLITQFESKLPFYISSIGVRENQEHIMRPSGYPDFHWIHCTKGSGILLLEGGEHAITEGMGFFLYPGTPHEYYSVHQPWETHFITFNGFSVLQLLNNLHFKERSVFYIENTYLVSMQLKNIYTCLSSADSKRSYESSILLYRFLIEAENYITPEGGAFTHLIRKQLEPVILFMENNFRDSPSLEEMAVLIGITPYHLCRLFKQAFNMRPFVYFTRVRIQKAKEMLIENWEKPVKAIAQSSGYNDTSYFCAVFKEFEGITPTQFRKMHSKGDISQ